MLSWTICSNQAPERKFEIRIVLQPEWLRLSPSKPYQLQGHETSRFPKSIAVQKPEQENEQFVQGPADFFSASSTVLISAIGAGFLKARKSRLGPCTNCSFSCSGF